MPRFEACIFDFYGTLAEIHTDEEKAELWEKLALFYGYYGACYRAGELKEAYRRIAEEMAGESGAARGMAYEVYPEMQVERVFQRLFEEKGVKAKRELAVYTGQLFRVLSTDYLRLYEGTRGMLEKVKGSGSKVYLLSNAQRIFTEYEMRALGLEGFFDGIFLSSDFGCRKPDERFFEGLLGRYGIVRERAVMVGNDGVCDIDGAKGVGLATLFVRSGLSPMGEEPRADFVLERVDMGEVGMILVGE
ncbi:MAG: HAD family hydrolase [Eubacteriales bacterium]|nr:HAD family hydrolase [Eubacteriales bacterium]